MSEALRIVVAGGGTGGHVYPGLAVVERLEARVATAARFVGARGGVEEKILAGAGRDYDLLPGYGLRGATIARKLGAPFVLGAGVVRAARVLSAFRPDVVLGTGGYASAAVVVASLAFRIPRVLQEQTAFPVWSIARSPATPTWCCWVTSRRAPTCPRERGRWWSEIRCAACRRRRATKQRRSSRSIRPDRSCWWWVAAGALIR
jgi:UDP-N-acetylglucosamine:LPS N-acetylglucosamine transferase